MTAADFDLNELLDLLGMAFGAEKREYFHRVITLDPERERGRTFLHRQGGTLVAAVHVFCRRARWGDSGEAVAGVIGNVATHPDYRGRGFAGSLLQEAMDWMRESGFDFGLLFTGLRGYYERWGWRPAPYSFLAVPAAGWSAGLGEYCIRRMEQADVPALEAIHRIDPGAPCGPFLRSGLYWSQHLQWLNALGREEPEAFWVAVRPGQAKPVAYIRCGLARSEQRLRLLEAGSAAGVAGYRDLLGAAFGRAQSEGLSIVELHLAPDHPILGAFAKAEGAQWGLRHGPMVHDLGRADNLNPPLAEARPFFWQTDWC